MIEVHRFFSEVPHFRRLRHALLNPKTDSDNNNTAVIPDAQIPWPRYITRKSCRTMTKFPTIFVLIRSPVIQKPF